MKSKVLLENKVRDYLQQYENIVFAMIFGSFAAGNLGAKSDLDIAIYCKEEFDLIKLGRIIIDLKKYSPKKIDVIELNNLFNKSNLLAYQIVTNNRLLFSRDDDVLIEFKRKTLLSYFDTERLRQAVNSAFYKRISSKKFGERNYA